LARVKIFYKGRRKRRNIAIIPFIILLLIISLILVTFYGLQKYAVVTKDKVGIELPMLADESDAAGPQSVEAREYGTVDTQIIFDEADYSNVEAVRGNGLSGVRAIFVPSENLTPEKLAEYAGRLNAGNALLLEMKPRSGRLMWKSNAELAVNYAIPTGYDPENPIEEQVAALKEQGIYLAAQISCCVDEALSMSLTSVCLLNAAGSYYRDDTGTWLDAYSPDVRNYIAQLIEELYEMGFDEVVLADVAHPVVPVKEGETPPPDQFRYTREISTPRSPVNAVCGFAVNIAQRFADREGALSIYCDSRTALVRPDKDNGQDAELFLKVYDRVYLKTDKYTYSFNITDIEPRVHIGNKYDRLVPVVENYIPENSSWILIDVEEE